MKVAQRPNSVADALADVRRRLVGVAGISGAINLLMLSGSIYMLQVYDRVLPSRNVSTLVGLSVLVLAAYLLQGCLDAIRSRMLAGLPLRGVAPSMVQQPLRDLELVRAFLSGMGPTAFLDMPWLPIFVLVLFLFHPLIGLVAITGAALIIFAALFAERQSRLFALGVAKRSAERAALADEIRRNAEVLHALGMRERFKAAWCHLNEAHIAEAIPMRDAEADIGAAAKVLRYALQSAVLCVGAALVVGERASGGIMIASSIIMGRALAPIEIVLGTWKQLIAARDAVQRLQATLGAVTAPSAPAVALPAPVARLSVQHLAVIAPGSNRVIVRNVSFSLAAGAGLALL